MYSVKNVKTFRGMDTEGFNATLCREKVKVAECVNDGHGGETFFRWFDYDAPRVLIAIFVREREGETREISVTPEEALFYQYCQSLPDYTLYVGIEGTAPVHRVHSPDIVIDELVNDFINARRFKRLCKNHIVFRMEARSYTEGEWDSIKTVFSPESKERIIARYGPCEFMNESIF
jgi:hypothetical protein